MKKFIFLIGALLTATNLWPHHGETLVAAAESGNVALVRALIDSGVPVNSRNGSGDTALLVAARKRNFPLVQLLVKRGADVDYVQPTGLRWTALMYAAHGQHTDVVTFLLEKSASPAILDMLGKDAVDYAVPHSEILHAILDAYVYGN